MAQEIKAPLPTVPQKCIMMRGGMQHWVSEDTVNTIIRWIEAGNKGLVNITELNSFINVSDISGIYSPAAMETYTRQKNGEWQCKYTNWHIKGEQCKCGWQTGSFEPPEVTNPVKPETIAKVRETVNKIAASKGMK